MMWSDMFISSNAGTWYYNVDENVDTTNWTKPADDLALVYWDYYNTDRSVYRKMLRVHHEIAKNSLCRRYLELEWYCTKLWQSN